MKGSLIVGSYGWQEERISAEFYPEDLPKDWQLDYYCNFSNLVVVPESLWLSDWLDDNRTLDVDSNGFKEAFEESQLMAAEPLEAFEEALTEESLVYLVVEKAVEPSVMISQLERLSRYFVIQGMIFKLEPNWVEQDFKRVLTSISALHAHDFGAVQMTVTVVWPQGQPLSASLAEEVNTVIAIEPTQQVFEFKGQCYAGHPILWIDSLPENGRAQSQCLQQFMQAVTANGKPLPSSADIPVVVAGCEGQEKTQMSWVQNLKTVSELLGY